MDIMVVFDAVIVVFGIYMIGSALKMKKTGEISSAVLAPEELKKCRDKQGFIAFMYWKEALFGGLVSAVGVLGIVNHVVVSLGAWNLIEMIAFLAAFLWFQRELRRARRKFI